MLFQKVLFLDTSKAPFHKVFVVKSIGHKQHRIKGGKFLSKLIIGISSVDSTLLVLLLGEWGTNSQNYLLEARNSKTLLT